MNRRTDNMAVSYISDKRVCDCVQLWFAVVVLQYMVFLFSVRVVGSLATSVYDKIGPSFFTQPPGTQND